MPADQLPNARDFSGGGNAAVKTLLVLAEHPGFAEAIRAGINPEHYRIIAPAFCENSELSPMR